MRQKWTLILRKIGALLMCGLLAPVGFYFIVTEKFPRYSLTEKAFLCLGFALMPFIAWLQFQSLKGSWSESEEKAAEEHLWNAIWKNIERLIWRSRLPKVLSFLGMILRSAIKILWPVIKWSFVAGVSCFFLFNIFAWLGTIPGWAAVIIILLILK